MLTGPSLLDPPRSPFLFNQTLMYIQKVKLILILIFVPIMGTVCVNTSTSNVFSLLGQMLEKIKRCELKLLEIIISFLYD